MSLKENTNYKQLIKKFNQDSKTFSFASSFFDKNTRKDIAYLYSIFRNLDDIVDNADKSLSSEEIIKLLEKEAKKTEYINFLNEKGIPMVYYLDLVTGLKSDINFEFKQNFDELYYYCYCVAGSIGIMISKMLGANDQDVLKKAEELGVAMQLTNILRDIKTDARMNRIYIPLEDLKNNEVDKKDIFDNKFTPELKEIIIKYEQIARNYYIKGNSAIKYLPASTRLAIKTASKTYEGILDELNKIDYNPFLGRAVVSKQKKLYYLLRAII